MSETDFSRMGILCGVLAVLWSCGPVARADFLYGTPTRVPNVNTDSAEESQPQISRDGLELYFLSARRDAQGESSYNIWVSKRSTTREPWPAPTKLDAPVNTTGAETSPSLSADGLELYFSNGYVDLWVSTRATKNDPWGQPVKLGPPVNSEYAEDCPCISADGLSLYFISDRPGGGNNSDIFVTTRTSKNSPWGEPVNLGPNVNSSQYEYTPFISPDGLMLFFSRGFSKAHVYVCTRRTTADPWGPAEFFAPVNSGTDVRPNSPGSAEWNLSFSQEDSTLYFGRCTDLFSNDKDIWQVKMTPIFDFNGDSKVDEKDFLIMAEHWGQDYPRCDIGPMGWGDGVVDAQDLMVLLRHVTGSEPMTPLPQAAGVSPEGVLSWVSPPFAEAYDVYLGASFVDVNSATRADPRGTGVSNDQTATTYNLAGLLEPGRTYYWRVDFVGAGPNPTIYKGPVLVFTTGTSTHLIENVIATASSAQIGSGPEKTVDGSGLDQNDGHSTDAADMWMSLGVPPNWIQYEFDKAYKLREMWVWNSNLATEARVGFGARSVKIEYSTDGATWTVLKGVPEFARALGVAGYIRNTIVSFGGVSAKFVKLTIEKGWGTTPSVGLSEVRFFYTPSAGLQ